MGKMLSRAKVIRIVSGSIDKLFGPFDKNKELRRKGVIPMPKLILIIFRSVHCVHHGLDGVSAAQYVGGRLFSSSHYMVRSSFHP